MPDEFALPLSGGGLNAATLAEAISPRLWKVTAEAENAFEAGRRIVASAELLAEAQDKLSLVSRLAAPMGPEDCYVALQPLVIMYGIPAFGEGEDGDRLRAAWWASTQKALCDLPKESLEYAVDRYIATATKHLFPDPGILRKICEEHATQVRMVAWRIRKAVEDAAERARRTDPETKKIVGAEFGSLAEELRARRPRTMPDAPVARNPNAAAVADLVRQGYQPGMQRAYREGEG
jgi:hypothetical protein